MEVPKESEMSPKSDSMPSELSDFSLEYHIDDIEESEPMDAKVYKNKLLLNQHIWNVKKLAKQNTVDDHSKLFDKYEQIIASSISNSKLDAKLDIFKSDIIRHIEEMLNSFNIRVLRGINNKIDKKDFKDEIANRVHFKDFLDHKSKVNNELFHIKGSIQNTAYLVESVLKENLNKLNLDNREINRFEIDRENQKELNYLKSQVDRIKGIIEQIHEPYSDSNTSFGKNEILNEKEDISPSTDNQIFENKLIKSSGNTDKISFDYPLVESKNKFVYLKESDNDYYADNKPVIELYKADLQFNSEINPLDNSESNSISSPKSISKIEINKKQNIHPIKLFQSELSQKQLPNSKLESPENKYESSASITKSFKVQESKNSKPTEKSQSSKSKDVRAKVKELSSAFKNIYNKMVNVQDQLEQLKSEAIRNTEITAFQTNEFSKFNSQLSECRKIHQRTTERSIQLENQFAEGLVQLSTVNKQFNKVQTDTINKIEEFRNEYKDGFKRIVRCEIDLRDLSLKYKIIKDKTMIKINNKSNECGCVKIESSKVVQHVENKFTDIYNKINEIAHTQTSLNNSKGIFDKISQYEFQDLK